MNILSLFDWISCGRVALERAWIKVDKYFASEIDKYAIQVAKKNYPDTIHIGSIKNIYVNEFWWDCKDDDLITGENYTHINKNSKIDMIIWWSPCQDLSIAKKDWKGLQWEKSWLFFEYVRLLKEIKPKYFLLENVASMKKADKEEITRVLTEIYPDVQCYLINSALVSAQNRRRYYWSNIQWVEQPEDKWIVLKDILEESVNGSFVINRDGTEKYKSNTIRTSGRWSGIDDKHNWDTIRVWQFNSGWQWDRVYSPEWKSVSLSANGGGRGAKTGLYEVGIRQIPRGFNKWWLHIEKSPTLSSCSWEQNNKLDSWWIIRKLTPIECERLQTLEDDYTSWISNTQRYKAIGNWWTVNVIAHIFSYIK